MNAEERAKGVDKLEVLQLCKDFLGNKWSAVNEGNFDFQVLAQGFGNRLFVVGVKEGTADEVEPRQVLVRYYGGNFLPQDMPNRTMTEAGEVLTFYCLGKSGIGPQLYGVFKGGRIEEFIPSTIFTMDEFCEDEQVSEAIARVLARFHAVDVPVKKVPQDPVKLMRRYLCEFFAANDDFPSPLPPADEEEAKEMEELLASDNKWDEEVAWIEKTLPLIKSRTVFAHNDVNRGNMILRLDDGSNKPLDQRLLLVDYEFNGYNYRGCDIANHFTMRVIDFGNNDNPFTGRPYPNEEKKCHFIKTYLNECKKLPVFSQDWDENGADSLEQVLLEAEFYCLVNQVIMNIFWMKNRAHFARVAEKRGEQKQTGRGGPAASLRFFKQRKAEFLFSYPQYA